MSECYMVDYNEAWAFAGNTWMAQTFTPHQDHSPIYVAIKCQAYYSTTDYVIIEIRTTSASKPTNVVLASAKLWFSKFYGTLAGGTFMVTLDPLYPLVNGTLYALVIREGSIRLGWQFIWRGVKNTGTYAFGNRLMSANAGASWTAYPNDDFCFSEWGYPPAPTTPPVPPLTNFAVLDVVQILTTTGYRFYVSTDVPCHLYMLYVIAEPGKHKTEIIRRGERWKDAIRFCFVNPIQNEQEEEGDTIYHTFIKEPWAGCETRWFTFRATIDGVWSPSATAIFIKHRPVGLLFAEPYTLLEWPPVGPLFADEYTIDPDPPMVIKFTERYTW